MPITLDNYKGLQVLPGTPSDGGAAISDKATVDWHSQGVPFACIKALLERVKVLEQALAAR